ncbi:MAG: magnesium transporter [Nitrospirae bacterium]|nr:magnesium transporter [Nitrospirota bacterium]
MPLFGELFVSEILGKSVLDPMGDDLGRVKDFIVVKGDPLPRISAIVLEKKKDFFKLEWDNIGIFNKRIISANVYSSNIVPYEFSEDELLIVRDVLDKQIVDANGAKVVRVNDVKFGGINSYAYLTDIDVGVRGILRRLGMEKRGENIYGIFGRNIPHNLIRWNYLQPLEPKLTTITLTVPRQMLSALHPADIADIISRVSHEEGSTLFEGLDPNVAAEALHELEPDAKKAIIQSLDKELASDIVERMAPDEAADLIGDLPPEKAKELLESIEKEEAEDIQELLVHEEDTAGGLMTNEFIAYSSELLLSDVIEKFKMDAHSVENVYYIYVIDENKKLIGAISLKDLLLSSPSVYLSEIMETKLKTVTADTDQQSVAELTSKYNLLAVPVIDDEGVLLGVVTIDDIVDFLLPPLSKKRRRKV